MLRPLETVDSHPPEPLALQTEQQENRRENEKLGADDPPDQLREMRGQPRVRLLRGDLVDPVKDDRAQRDAQGGALRQRHELVSMASMNMIQRRRRLDSEEWRPAGQKSEAHPIRATKHDALIHSFEFLI